LEKIPFGSTGLTVARIGLGGYPFGGRQLSAGWDPWTPEGRNSALATIRRAMERGVNYMDTAPGYGDGNSESIFGEALKGRRDRAILATKCGWKDLSAAQVRESVHASLKRLLTDYADVIQFHGGMFEPQDAEHILNGGPLDALERLQAEGAARFIGFTAEEPWTARPLIASGRFQVAQIRYNLIYQGAALHVLNEAQAAGMGVTVMRPMTSGIFQRLVSFLAPEWGEAKDLYETALQFVLSDSRVHVANVGMRSPEEVDRNVDMAESFVPPLDVAELPRMTAGIYRKADEEAGW
jgi:aryl-alcohol dehydrogenase-like predicted oxidoreductase